MDEVFLWLQGGGGTLGAASLVGIFIILVFTGRIVPNSTVMKMLEFREQQIRDWRDAYLKSEEARGVQDKQVQELLEHSRTTVRVLESLQRTTTPNRSDAGHAP